MTAQSYIKNITFCSILVNTAAMYRQHVSTTLMFKWVQNFWVCFLCELLEIVCIKSAKLIMKPLHFTHQWENCLCKRISFRPVGLHVSLTIVSKSFCDALLLPSVEQTCCHWYGNTVKRHINYSVRHPNLEIQIGPLLNYRTLQCDKGYVCSLHDKTLPSDILMPNTSD